MKSCEEEEEKLPWPEEIKNHVNPILWTAGRSESVKWASPVKAYLKPKEGTPTKRQYPLQKEALGGICLITRKFQKHGLSQPCHSLYNTRTLPVKKLNSDKYQFVQYLGAISDIVQESNFTVPNPCTFKNSILEDNLWCSVLDLQDAFLCILVDQDSMVVCFWM